jgi:hypothetical protein
MASACVWGLWPPGPDTRGWGHTAPKRPYVDLGSSQYYVPPGQGGNLTFSASAIAYLPATHSLQIVLGTMNNPGTLNAVQASPLTLNLSAGILDAGDNPLTGYIYTTASGPQF